MEERKKGKKFLYMISERLKGKYSNKKENYYNEEVNKRKAPRSKDSKEEKSSKKSSEERKKEGKGKTLKMRIQKNLRGHRIMKRI